MMVQAHAHDALQHAGQHAVSEELVYVGLDEFGTPLAVAFEPDGHIYIALREPALDAFRIVQLQPRR